MDRAGPALLLVVAAAFVDGSPEPARAEGRRAEGCRAEGCAVVERRIAESRPSAEERALDRIGWARDLREARRLAALHRRPVFLFTHDGRINTGRC